jgi:hypothetical protein
MSRSAKASGFFLFFRWEFPVFTRYVVVREPITKEMKMRPEEIVALGKVVVAKQAQKASAELMPGDYEVDFVVRVSGTVRRGEDYSQKIVLKADPWTMLAAALSHLNGVTVESLVKEALHADPELVGAIKAGALDAMARLNAPTETACNGKVTVKVAADELPAGAVALKKEED